jgi:hypothetical protein
MRCGRLGQAERRRQLSQGAGHAVITVPGDDDTGTAGAGSSDAQGEVVGLAAGAGEHDVADLGREGRQQLLGVIEYGLVQIARMRVEEGRLSRDRLDDVRVAVPDGRHIIISIQIAIAGGIVEPNAFAAYELHRLLVEQPIGRPEQPVPAGDDVLDRDSSIVC